MKEGLAAVIIVIMIVIGVALLDIPDGPFDYQNVFIIGGDVIITIMNDIDVPLAAHYFAEQQAKKHNAYFLGADSSISIRLKSWGWSWGKQHQREEYTYHYKFYYKKRGSHEKISD